MASLQKQQDELNKVNNKLNLAEIKIFSTDHVVRGFVFFERILVYGSLGVPQRESGGLILCFVLLSRRFNTIRIFDFLSTPIILISPL